MTNIYKSEILDQEYNLITFNGRKVIRFDCVKCNNKGFIPSFSHMFEGECFACEGKGFITRTMQTIKRWEKEALQVRKECEEFALLKEYTHTVERLTPKEEELYRLSKVDCLEDGLQEITGTVENIYGKDTPYGFVVKMVLNVNGNLLWVNQTKALEEVTKGETITIDLDVTMFNIDERKGSAKAGRRKLKTN